MENPFSASRAEMHELFLASHRRRAGELIQNAMAIYPYEEVERQIASRSGPIIEQMDRDNAAFARRTENVEFTTALGLSDFYFGPDVETAISFEMRRDFRPHINLTYEELIENIESATHIDCAIRFDNTTLNFQIKRYPQAYLEHTNEALLAWLDEEVLGEYGNMNGTILIILLQANTPPTPTGFRFVPLSESIISRAANITFDEIAFSYSEISPNGEFSVLRKMFPEQRRIVAPLEWMMRRFRGEV